jgi:small-conductance mechanosensitive channel
MTRLARICALLLALVLGVGAGMSPVPGTAQAATQSPAIDYEAWERIAKRADAAIEAGRASTHILEDLRQDLSNWRQRFQQGQNVNSSAIANVQRQLDALGPPPEDRPESADIAAQRAELTQRLATLREPVRNAELAYSRAVGLIAGLDAIIRARQAEEVLEFGPSPLNPAHWPPGLRGLYNAADDIRFEVASAWRKDLQRAQTRENLPGVILLLVVGVILMARGRRWSKKLSLRILCDDPGAGRWLLGFVVSIGSILLPFLGVFALTEAFYATALVGLRGEQMLTAILPASFAFLLARWLASRVFPTEEARTLPLMLDRDQRRFGRWYGGLLGAAAALSYVLQEVGGIADWSPRQIVVIQFPFMVLCGMLLWRLAGLLRVHVRAQIAAEGEETYGSRAVRVLSLALLALALLTPVLGAVGYFKLAQWLLYPSLASLQLLALLLVLQRLVTEIYVLITGNRQGAAESLVPVLLGFAIVLASVPVFALIWGARVADLLEIWMSLVNGISIGGVLISPAVFFTFALVFSLGYAVTRLIQGTLRNTILPKTRLDTGGRNALVAGVGYLGIFLAAIIAITSAGIDLSSIAIVAGALSVGIGFGLQTIVSNFVSGIILLIERPISEGDWIEVGGTHGTVRDISVRATIIQTFDRSDVIVPNADLVTGRVTNYTRGNTVGRVIVAVGVAYGTDTKRVEAILQEVAENHPMVMAVPAPFVLFRGFGASSLDFEIRAILRDVNWVMNVHSDMNHEIARRFVEEGIEIPFAQTDIWLRNPETLSGYRAPATGGQTPEPKPDATPLSKAQPAAAQPANDADGDGGAGDGR